MAEQKLKEWRREVEASRVFVYSEQLGRLIRAGAPSDQRHSNHFKIEEALAEQDATSAAAYGLVFLSEAELERRLTMAALRDVRGILQELGIEHAELGDVELHIRELLRLPDGSDFDPDALWSNVVASWCEFDEHCRLKRGSEALAVADSARELWRQFQDRQTDMLSGLLNEVLIRAGEEGIHDAWVRLNEPIFADRYSRYDVSKVAWAEGLDALVYITFEGGRYHLVGRDRTGDCEFEDQGDRWAWRWDPCGTCGRTIRGDSIEGTPPRPEPPYNWPVISKAYDWSWNKAGISAYGVQACIKLEQMGIDHFGYPIRVVECPTYPDAKDQACVRYVYKDPTKVPAEYYERVGRSKPSEFGSAASRRVEARHS